MNTNIEELRIYIPGTHRIDLPSSVSKDIEVRNGFALPIYEQPPELEPVYMVDMFDNSIKFAAFQSGLRCVSEIMQTYNNRGITTGIFPRNLELEKIIKIGNTKIYESEFPKSPCTHRFDGHVLIMPELLGQEVKEYLDQTPYRYTAINAKPLD